MAAFACMFSFCFIGFDPTSLLKQQGEHTCFRRVSPKHASKAEAQSHMLRPLEVVAPFCGGVDLLLAKACASEVGG